MVDLLQHYSHIDLTTSDQSVKFEHKSKEWPHNLTEVDHDDIINIPAGQREHSFSRGDGFVEPIGHLNHIFGRHNTSIDHTSNER
jgi:hypothetical protein